MLSFFVIKTTIFYNIFEIIQEVLRTRIMKNFLIGIDRSGFWLRSIILSTVCLIVAFNASVMPANAISVYSLPQVAPGDLTWVVDSAEAISRATESTLNNKLAKLAKDTGLELRMVAIHRQGYDDTVDVFTEKLFARWFSDAETAANQTLVTIDTVTNNSAIATGAEAKKLLSQEMIDSIISETIAADLKLGNKYNQAFLDASDRIATILAGQSDPGPSIVQNKINTEGTFTKAEDTDRGSATFWVIGLLIVATIVPMATYFFYVGFSN